MKEFKLALYIKFLILVFLIVISVIAVGILMTSQLKFEMLALAGILFIFAIYLLKVFIAINKDTFRKIIVDKTSGKIMLATTKQEVLALPFDDIAAINMTKGEVLRGIPLGHITIVTREQKAYGVTISNSIDEFYVEIPKEIEQTLEEATFYQPRWNKL